MDKIRKGVVIGVLTWLMLDTALGLVMLTLPEHQTPVIAELTEYAEEVLNEYR